MKRLAVLVVALAALSACGGLPTPAGVKVVRSVGAAVDDTGDQVRVLPPGPAADAGPADVVTGFLNAESDSDESDYSVAREFLAASASWSTGGTVGVYANPSTAVHVAADGASATVVVTSTLVATVDAHGVYTAQDRATTDSYALTKVRGAWRIATPPSGLRLTSTGLQRTFTVATLWWFTPDQRRLVPEQRWLPEQTTGRATQLVRSLLGGPSAAYAGAVRTAVPPGTTLEGSVVGDGGEVAVDLSRDAVGVTPGQAQQLLVQLAATLRDVSAVTGVRLLVDGQPLPAAGEPRRATVAEATPYLPATTPTAPVLYVAAGRVAVLGSGRSLPAAVTTALAHLSVTRAVPSPDGTAVAVVAGGRVLLVRSDGSVRQVAAAADAALSWTQDGRLAVALPTSLLLTTATGPITQIAYPAGLPGPVADLRIARDGVRVVLAAGQQGARQAYLAILDGDTLGSPVALDPSTTDVTQVAWQDATDVAFVVVPAKEASQLVTASVDGSGVNVVALPAAVGSAASLAAGPGSPVLAAGGTTIEELNGEENWHPVAKGTAPGIG